MMLNFNNNYLTVFFRTEQEAGAGSYLYLDMPDTFTLLDSNPVVTEVDSSGPFLALPTIALTKAVKGDYCGTSTYDICSTKNRLVINFSNLVTLKANTSYAFV